MRRIAYLNAASNLQDQGDRMTRQLAPILAAAALAALPVAAHAAGDAAAGKQKFDMLCASCHGTDGKGDGPAGAALNPPPRDFTKAEFKYDANKDGKTGTDEDLTLIIKNGAAAYGGSPLMVAWGGPLSDADIQNVIAYLRTFHK
jgi:mono/diheme cytochrome c family protein